VLGGMRGVGAARRRGGFTCGYAPGGSGGGGATAAASPPPPASFLYGSTSHEGLPVWLLTAGCDRVVRCWDLDRPRASHTVCGGGLEPGEARDGYDGGWVAAYDPPGPGPRRGGGGGEDEEEEEAERASRRRVVSAARTRRSATTTRRRRRRSLTTPSLPTMAPMASAPPDASPVAHGGGARPRGRPRPTRTASSTRTPCASSTRSRFRTPRATRTSWAPTASRATPAACCAAPCRPRRATTRPSPPWRG
jgi:hypothetical protein